MNTKYRFFLYYTTAGWIAQLSWGQDRAVEISVGYEFPADYGKSAFLHLIALDQ